MEDVALYILGVIILALLHLPEKDKATADMPPENQ